MAEQIPSQSTSRFDELVEQEFSKRLAAARDEMYASAYDREEAYADEMPFTQLTEDAFDGGGIKMLIRMRLVARTDAEKLREAVHAALGYISADIDGEEGDNAYRVCQQLREALGGV